MDQDLNALAKAVKDAIAAAEGEFAYRTSASGNTGSNAGDRITSDNNTVTDEFVADSAGETEIADEEVPLAGQVDGIGSDETGNAAESTEIADEDVPMTGGISEDAGEKRTETSAEAEAKAETGTAEEEATEDETLEDIADDEVPLAAAVESNQSSKNTIGIAGMISAAFAALLLLFKRKKGEEEKV